MDTGTTVAFLVVIGARFRARAEPFASLAR